VNCEQRKDLFLLYVADALEADVRQEMRRHLATGCPECAGYLAEAEATFHSIPQALEPVTPAANVKKRLMDRIAAEENRSAAAAGRSELPPDSLPIRLFKFFVPAAVAAGVAIVATHAFMSQKLQKLAVEASASKMDANASRMLLAAVQEQFQSQTQVVEMLRAPDVKVVHLTASKFQPSMVANVVWDQQNHRWLFLATGLKPAPEGQAYEMWVIPKGGTPLPAGMFSPDAQGRALVTVDLPKGSGPSNIAAVTNETASGVPAPKGDIQVSGAIE
jgi:anti-sigma-K factor RskA